MRTHLLIRLFLICVFSFPVWANNPVTGKYSINRAETPDVTNSFVLPYFFTGETTGFNVGIGGAVKGYGQDQLLLGATAWGGKDSYGVAAALVDYLTPWSDRLFFSSNILFSHAPNRRAYAGEQSIPTPIDQPFPGSSGSSPDQYLQGGSQSNWLEFKLEYVLPIGDRKHRSIKDYRLRGGLLVDGPSSVNWNPLRDGATTLILHQYNRYQSFDTEQGYYDGDVNAFAIGGQYDNNDFAPKPSMGSRQYLGSK